MRKLIRVAINDFRLVFRDNSLKVFIALPLLNLLVIRYGVPYVVGVYEVLHDYISIILMMATMQGSTAFGFIYSMVLIDEKDTSVARVYGILPVSKFWFVVFRLAPPFVLATAATFLLLLIEPFYELPLIPILAYSALAGLVSPLMILFIATIATNKIEAMTWQKLFNVLVLLPLLALFTPSPFPVLFAILPPYWLYAGLDALIGGYGYWTNMLIGLVYEVLLLVWMTQRFTLNHFK